MCDYLVTDDEIKKAEQDIFENDEHFNEEQKIFLKCLDSCCLQAYAGTGKTSTIAGKLHILAQKNVWRNGRGICVISHTNVAVDEIKKHVAKHYPQIMEYPNFVGTIQEFINKFLFIPYLQSKGLQIKFQDNTRFISMKDIEDIKITERIKKHYTKIGHGKYINAQKNFLDRFRTIHINNKKIFAQDNNKGVSEYTDLKTSQVTQDYIFRILSNTIQKKHIEGSFLFIESFIYGFEYLKQNPDLKKIISERFQFLFLDEAQDCSELQMNILNTLFEKSSKTILQQIGDVNQTIVETNWNPDEQCLHLEKSTRFGGNITNFINNFKIDNGSGLTGSEKISTQEILIIYTKGKEKEILPLFAKLIKTENIPDYKKYFAICRKHENLNEYFSEYSKNLTKNKDKKTSYYFNEDIEYIKLLTIENLKKHGTNIISKILMSLLYKYSKNEKKSLKIFKNNLLAGTNADTYKKLLLEIFNDLLKNKTISDLDNLKNSLNNFLEEKNINFSKKGSIKSSAISVSPPTNKFIYDEIEIDIGTIHSVKGQTHSATLMFSIKSDKKQDIQQTIDNTKKFGPIYKKILYVASSRPKYLFALAIEKNAYESLSSKNYFNDFEKITI